VGPSRTLSSASRTRRSAAPTRSASVRARERLLAAFFEIVEAALVRANEVQRGIVLLPHLLEFHRLFQLPLVFAGPPEADRRQQLLEHAARVASSCGRSLRSLSTDRARPRAPTREAPQPRTRTA